MKLKGNENGIKTVFLVIITMFLVSCAPQAQIDMLDRNVSGLKVETNRMDQELQSLKRQLSQVTGEAGQSGRKSIARLNARMDSLESELMRINGLVDQLKYNQEREESELAQLKEAIQNSLQKTASRPTAVAPASSVKSQPATTTISPKPNQLSPKEKETDLYQEGLSLFKLKKYQDAKKAFRNFIKEHPTSPKVANAHFWIGECEYRLSRYEEAILEYNKVINKYPKSNKVPDALLKQGFAFAKLGDKESARILLKRLIKNYPNTPQAKAAKRQLKLLR